jgi:hypothetical protein
MAPNFPTTYDDYDSLFGSLVDFAIFTLDGAINDTVTLLDFNETADVDRLDIYTELTFFSKGIGSTSFTGGGLDDMTTGGTFTGFKKKTDYRVELDDVASSPDTFKWSNDGGSTWVATGVAITGSAQSLENGVTITFGAIDGHTLGERWDFPAGFEVVRITSKGVGGSGEVTVIRGYDESTPLSHINAAQAVQDPIASHFSKIRDSLIAAETYKGLVGTSPPGTAAAGEFYINTSTSRWLATFVADTWEVLNRPDHGDYANLGADDHTNLQIESRKITWHDGLTGEHLTNPTTHEHTGGATDGDPVEKFETGLESSKPSAMAIGQVYYGYNAGQTSANLSFSPDGSAWELYTAMPKGTLLYFEGGCPLGWSDPGGLDGKLLRGAGADVWTGLASGGTSTHVHALPDIVPHATTVLEKTGVWSTDPEVGDHNHSLYIKSGTDVHTRLVRAANKDTTYWAAWDAGDHTHAMQVAADETADSGNNPANTNTASTFPSYRKLRICRND